MIGEGLGVYRSAGARFLIARRLVEAGARFVTVTFGAWDTHAYHYRGIEPQMPDFDRAFAGLITDLDQRGLLDSTLVVVNSEFGRTPEDQRRRRPRPLAAGLQHRPGRRRDQARPGLRGLRRAGRRARPHAL